MIHVGIEQVVRYHGHSLAASGLVNLTFKAMYSELTKTIELHQMLNNDIVLKAKVPGSPGILKLGIFRIKGLNTDSDGCSTIKLIGTNTCVEMDNLNYLPTKHDDEDLFRVRYETDVEVEDDE